MGRGWCTIDVRRPGGWYLAGLLLTALARTALHGYNLELTKRIMTSLYNRDRAAFQGTLSMQLLLGVGFALQPQRAADAPLYVRGGLQRQPGSPNSFIALRSSSSGL